MLNELWNYRTRHLQPQEILIRISAILLVKKGGDTPPAAMLLESFRMIMT